MHGFLSIDKPAGITSHDVVARVRRLAHQKRVGHAGTLDPAATGVLVVALGAATRLIEYVQEQTSKRYLATIRLGVATDTEDAEGAVIAELPVPALDERALEETLAHFRGTIEQVPPMYSALHHQGRRLHELAREGITVDRPARAVTIERLDLLAWDSPLLTVDVLCGKGTYIRSLARDIGAALGCGAHLAGLRRTAVGAFTIDTAVPLASLRGEPDAPTGPREDRPGDAELVALSQALLPPEHAVLDWPALRLDEAGARRIRNGMALDMPGAAERARAHGPDGALLALLARDGNVLRPTKVFEWTAAD